VNVIASVFVSAIALSCIAATATSSPAAAEAETFSRSSFTEQEGKFALLVSKTGCRLKFE
jgi:hypothetical protein